MCCQWVLGSKENRAIGVDLDQKVLDWARRNNLAELTAEQQRRVYLLRDNVISVATEKVDVIVAMNFSYYILKQRKQMIDYFKRCRKTLANDGILFLDAFGGYDAYREIQEATKNRKFTYIWDQAWYDPLSGDMKCHIHFEFPDGSKLHRAFSYEWRMWTMPEIKEMLDEAGFRTVTIYWEGTDTDSGEGNGIFRPVKRGEADAGWIAYIVAQK